MIRPIQNPNFPLLSNSIEFGKPARLAPSTDSISPETSCFYSIWEWVKAHVFCGFFTKIEEVSSIENVSTIETVDTCPIPKVTHGPREDRELNRLIREFYYWKSERHPDWNPYIPQIAMMFHEVYTKIENDEAKECSCFEEIELDWIYHSCAIQDFYSFVLPDNEDVDYVLDTITKHVRLLRIIYRHKYE